MDKTRWIIFSFIAVGILAIMVSFSGSSRIKVDSIDANSVQQANEQNGNIGDHVIGKIDSKVILINYGDFQCPHCATVNPMFKEVVDEYKNQILFIFRNFSISSFPNSKAASAAAEAAGLQDKYWEMHDKIYETQSDWSDLSINERGEFFQNLASELELDIAKFNTDVATTSITAKINFDFALGKKVGVDGTPSFFLNGVKLDPSEYSDKSTLKATIIAALKKAKIPLPTE